MPLSDREQQILSDIESRLRQEDPKFARAVSTTTVSSRARRQLKFAVTAAVLSFFLLLSAVPLARIWVALVGFTGMLAATVFGVNIARRMRGGGDGGNRGAVRSPDDRGRPGG
jgi:uncharacterized membrane protein YgcG